MERFLESLLPNSLLFYNRILQKDYKDLQEITKEDCKLIISKLKSMGMFLPLYVNKDNYNFEIIKDTEYFTVCNQYNKLKKSNMKVMVLKSIMMLDYDGITLEQVKEFLKKTKESYKIYKTYNGYHAYCTSKEYSFKNYKTLQLMKNLGCDELYISYCYFLGVCVRLTKKDNRDEKYIEKYECDIENSEKIEYIDQVLDEKDNYINFFID
jgi:hypothetical protein